MNDQSNTAKTPLTDGLNPRDSAPEDTRQPTLEESAEQEHAKALARRDAVYISDWNDDGWGFGG